MIKNSLTIQSDVLRWARLSLGLSLGDVSEKIKIDTSDLEKWEQEPSDIDIPTIKKLAKTYKRPVTALFLETPPEGIVPPDFRTLDSVKVESLSEEARLAIRQAQRNRVFFTELIGKRSISKKDFRFSEDVSNLAASLRKRIGVTIENQSTWDKNKALNNWIDLVEGINIPVFQTPLPIEEFRGFCLRGNDLVPAIVLNQRDFTNGRIFSLFHELYHVFLEQRDIDQLKRTKGLEKAHKVIETKANDFAASFLVPKNDFLDNEYVQAFIKTKEVKYVPKIKNYFKVSEDVVYRRFLTFNIISDLEYKEKQKELNEQYKNLRAQKKAKQEKSKKDFIPNYYRDLTYKTGFALGRKAFNALSEGKVTTYDLVNFFNVKTGKLERIKHNVDVHYGANKKK